MDSVQVGKAVFVKVSFASLGLEPRTLSYPGSCATNTLLAKKIFYSSMNIVNDFKSSLPEQSTGLDLSSRSEAPFKIKVRRRKKRKKKVKKKKRKK